jgi:phosphatidylglycerophosphate synthase
VNLPNAVTAGRIAITPLIAWLPLAPSSTWRLVAFILFTLAAITDYIDGQLARSRKEETDLGRLLDPLADKLLLLATFIPMYLLMRGPALFVPHDAAVVTAATATVNRFWFELPWGRVTLPLWIVLVVLGREAFMTIFRQIAARRGVVIAAIGPAKWKAGFQYTWVGSAYFWFFAATLADVHGWRNEPLFRAFAWFNGFVGTFTMVCAVALTLYSLWLYMRRYGGLLLGHAPDVGASERSRQGV